MAATKKKAKTVKRGFLSNIEIATIKEMRKKKQTAEQISIKLNRPIGIIQRKIDELEGVAIEPQPHTVGDALEKRPEWKKWKNQFTDDELESFKIHYVELMSQFDNDILATEELQIFQVITLIIMIDRTLAERKVALQDMEYWRSYVEAQRKGLDHSDPSATGLLQEYMANYEQARATAKTCADQYKIYSDKQDKLLQSLKGTRDQRVKVLENSGKSFLGFLRYLQEEDNKTKIGREIELMRLATDKERKRLIADHTYMDGSIDSPLLIPEAQEDDE